MRYFNYVFVLTLSLFLFSCQWTSNDPKSINDENHKVEVEEVIQANAYTYLKVKEGSNLYWIAAAKINVNAGDVLLYRGRLEMNNFESKDLNKKFDKIYFVEEIQKLADKGADAMDVKRIHTMMPKQDKVDISIDAPEAGISIADLIENKDNYKNQKVIVNGIVTKVNNGIMGKNWVHIQDGTEYNGLYDLVLTTQEIIEQGDTLIFEGTVRTNKDFGSGYKYDVILEEVFVK